jgi:hypothetical protein
MIPYDLDPSLYVAQPEAMPLDDGFSPPQPQASADETEAALEPEHRSIDPALWDKSPF